MNRNLLSFALALALSGAAFTASAEAAPNAISGEKWWGDRGTVGSWYRGSFEGRWMADDRYGPEHRGAGRAMLLPTFLNIDQGRSMVRIADARHNLLQVITLEHRFRVPRDHALILKGTLDGRRLVARGENGRGRDVIQIMSLRDRGRTLVVRTQVERGRSGRMVEYERTYHRA